MSTNLIEQRLRDCADDPMWIYHYEVLKRLLREAADEIARLRAENAELRAMLTRYRREVPLGHQPHMLAHAVDVALGRD